MATFYIPASKNWRQALMKAFRKAHPGDVIQLANRHQYNAALNVVADFPGVTIRVVETVSEWRAGLDISPGLM